MFVRRLPRSWNYNTHSPFLATFLVRDRGKVFYYYLSHFLRLDVRIPGVGFMLNSWEEQHLLLLFLDTAYRLSKEFQNEAALSSFVSTNAFIKLDILFYSSYKLQDGTRHGCLVF